MYKKTIVMQETASGRACISGSSDGEVADARRAGFHPLACELIFSDSSQVRDTLNHCAAGEGLERRRDFAHRGQVQRVADRWALDAGDLSSMFPFLAL